jgi:radical SAM protein with 4Fe4S-binding SPASM domain
VRTGAKKTVSVSPTVRCTPAPFFRTPFRVRKHKRDSLETIWREALAFAMHREIEIESCERCTRFNLCHGGCPAVAYFLQSL